MEHPQKQPIEHNDLRDPKLPVIHGAGVGNAALDRVCTAPIPTAKIEA